MHPITNQTGSDENYQSANQHGRNYRIRVGNLKTSHQFFNDLRISQWIFLLDGLFDGALKHVDNLANLAGGETGGMQLLEVIVRGEVCDQSADDSYPEGRSRSRHAYCWRLRLHPSFRMARHSSARMCGEYWQLQMPVPKVSALRIRLFLVFFDVTAGLVSVIFLIS